MGFSRVLAPAIATQGDALTRAMVGIGMNFGAVADSDANIEDTLLFACEEGMDRADLRVLAVLATWFGVHAPYVNADRLTRLTQGASSERVRAFFRACATWQAQDRRYARIASLATKRVDLLTTGTDFQLRRHGEDPRFAGGPLRVPANVLRDRPADVLTPTELARRHRAYRFRVMMGPSYRADMWAALDADAGLSAADLARKTYGSFASAWAVRRDFRVIAPTGTLATKRTDLRAPLSR